MKKILNGYKQQQQGVAAVEFALLATPLMMTVLGLIELSLFYASGIAVEGASTSSARVIRTGQAQISGDPLTMFQDTLCSQVGVFVDCANLTYEVINAGQDFSGVDMAPQFDAEGNMLSQGFDPGGSDEVVLVRVSYRYEFMTPFIGGMLDDGQSTNSSTFVSTVIIRNEPYTFNG